MGSQQGLDAIGLGVGQGAARADGAAGALVGQRVEAAVEVGGPPVADGLAGDAEDVGQVGLGEAQLAAAQARRRRTSRASSDNCRASGKERAMMPPSFERGRSAIKASVSILHAGVIGSRWAGEHDLLIGGRDASKARALAEKFGRGTKSGSEADAAAFGEVVVLATPHEAVFDAMNAAGGPKAFAGKVVLDINNPVADASHGDFLVKTFDGQSLAEAIAARLPAAHVVKAFNMCSARVWQMDAPVFDGRRLVTVYCGDDVGASDRPRG